MTTLTLKQLPPVVRQILKDAGRKERKVLVLSVKKGQGISDGSIVGTLGNVPVEQVPYHEGGGYRAQAAVVLVASFGGGLWLGVDSPTYRNYRDAGEVAIAVDQCLGAA